MSRTVLAFGTGGLRLAKDAALAAAAGLLPEEAGADFLCFHGRETDAAWQELRRLADRYEVARGLIGGPRLTFRRVQTGSALPEAEPDSRVLRQALLGSPDAQPAWTGLAGWYLSEGKAAAEALPETEEVLVCGAVHETDGCVPLRLLQRILPRACGGLLLLPWRDPADGRLEEARDWGAKEFCRRTDTRALVTMHSVGYPRFVPDAEFFAPGREIPLWAPTEPGERRIYQKGSGFSE